MSHDLTTVVERLRPTEARPDCPVARLKDRLRQAGLRPTRQRIILGWLLFARGDRHFAAEDLYAEAARARAELSLATVYNTLRQFTDAGLIRQVHIGAGKAYFDTNAGAHHHFVVEGEELVFDVPHGAMGVADPPEPPPGFRVVGVDVVVRLQRLPEGTAS